MKICIIPARGGSKRIPRKNIKMLNGKPMIAWPIETALKTSLFDRIIVSTDDPEIADIAISHGAEVPFVRPVELSDDFTSTRDVVIHTLDFLQRENCIPKWTCCIYPTTPFLKTEYLLESFHELIQQDLDFVFSSIYYDHPIQKAFYVRPDKSLVRLFPENRFARTQDLESALHDAGQFYWGNTQSFIEKKDSIESNSAAYILPKFLIQDIDTIDDWIRAEMIFKVAQEMGL